MSFMNDENYVKYFLKECFTGIANLKIFKLNQIKKKMKVAAVLVSLMEVFV